MERKKYPCNYCNPPLLCWDALIRFHRREITKEEKEKFRKEFAQRHGIEKGELV
jgi:hypothetical protein